MKKFISILIIICTLTLCLASCGGSNNNNSNNNQNTNENNDCATTGLHTYDKGECTGCGLKVFDVVKDYIIENGNRKPIFHKNEPYITYFYRITLDTLSETESTPFIDYDPETESISIQSCIFDYRSDYKMSLAFTPYVFEDGEYELHVWNTTFGSDIYGVLDPYKFNRFTKTLSHNSNNDDADELVRSALAALKNNMDEYYIDFFKSIGNNITIKDLGFVRYN